MKNRKVTFTKKLQAEVVIDDFDEKDLKPTDIAIKTRFSMISAGTELACYTGAAPWFKFPKPYGYLNLGQVIAAGKDVKGFKAGDIVYTSNNHVEYHKFDTANLNDVCMLLPAKVKQDEACFGRMGATSLTALRVSRIEVGDFVGVTGLGIIGNLACQFARLQGGTVIGMDLSEKRLQLAQKCGTPHVVKMGDKESVKRQVMEITGGRGVSTLIEATGYSEAVPEVLPCVSQYGTVVLLGTPRTEFQANLTEVFKSVHDAQNSVRFIGAHSRSIPFQPIPFMKWSHIGNVQATFDLLLDGRLNVKPLISHVLKPEDCARAYDGLKNKKDEYIGVIFDWKK